MGCSTYSSPRWSGEVADCGVPMTFDHLSKCSFGCLYCFAAFQKAIGLGKENYGENIYSPVSVSRIKRMFLEPYKNGKPTSQFSKYISMRKTMQWGGMADPFCVYEKKTEVGLELLKFFRSIKYPLTFSTKGTWFLNDKRYTDVIEGMDNWHFKVSIITLDEAKARKVEIGVASPEKRIEGIKKLKSLGVAGVTLRLRPFMIGITDPTHVELIEKCADAGIYSISTEFFCLDVRSTWLRKNLEIISKLVGFDYLEFYKKYSHKVGYYRLNRKVKERFVREMYDACERKGVKFFCSDSDFKELSHAPVCCGIPLESGKMKISKGQFTNALLIARKNGEVKWNDINYDMEHLKGFKFGSACGFNTKSSENRVRQKGRTMYDYIHWLWNNPDVSWQTPYKIFRGMLVPDRKEGGDIVYRYNKEWDIT